MIWQRQRDDLMSKRDRTWQRKEQHHFTTNKVKGAFRQQYGGKAYWKRQEIEGKG